MALDFVETAIIKLPDFQKANSVIKESENGSSVYLIEIAAIHHGLTANYNMYSEDQLEKSLSSWISPYPRPVIINHDVYSDALGRVLAARMDKEADGSPYLRIQVAISDPEAIEKVKSKRYLTGSVGGQAGKAICSISGEDLVQAEKDGKFNLITRYKKGSVYKGKLAYWNMEDISWKEYSFVNVPADSKSIIKHEQSSDENTVEDGIWTVKADGFVFSMENEEIYSVSQEKFLSRAMESKIFLPMYSEVKKIILASESSDCDNNTPMLLSKEENTLIDEENDTMSKNEGQQDQDIVDIVASLSEDLSSIAATSVESEDENEQLELTESNESEEEQSNQDNDEMTDSDNETEVTSNEEELEDSETEESEEASQEGDSSEDDTEEQELAQDSSAESEQLSNVDLQEKITDLESEIERLKNENNKLTTAIHRQLADRVVDTKISLGLEDASDRANLIEDHISRTTQSLADSLRDLAKYPSKQVTVTSPVQVAGENTTVYPTHGESNVISDNSSEQEIEEDEMSDSDRFVQVISDVLLNRRSI